MLPGFSKLPEMFLEMEQAAKHYLSRFAQTRLLPQWTDCIMGKILKKVEVGKFITTAFKNILKLVKLQSLVAKRSKMWKM